MVAIATCRYCDAGVPHEVCRESVVSSAETATHEHHYQAELSCDDPSYVVRDCACGHRIRVQKKGGHEIILDDGLVETGGSLANSVFVYRPEVNKNGVSWSDRWSV